MKIDYTDFTIVIPTLDEEKTIGDLIKYILRNYKGSRIVVADDGSADETQQVVKRLAQTNKEIMLIDRYARNRDRGLTGSVIDGIMKSSTRYVIVMDADMQHPPGKIADIAERLAKGDDLVVANRARVNDWQLYRKLISRFFMYLGKMLLYMNARETCVDIFSGFFGMKREIFVGVFKKNRERFVIDGYKVLYDFLKCEDRGKLIIEEVPFVFNIREHGSSKAGIIQGVALFKSFLT